MGINETRYGFMDEGWATTFEYLFGAPNMAKADRRRVLQAVSRRTAGSTTRRPLENIPIITPQDMLKGAAYGNNAYGRRRWAISP